MWFFYDFYNIEYMVGPSSEYKNLLYIYTLGQNV